MNVKVLFEGNGGVQPMDTVTPGSDQYADKYARSGLVQALLESTPDGIAHFSTDGIVAFANASFSALWQIAPDAIVGMTQADLHAHKLTMLTDPEHDGHLLSIVSGQVCSTETNYIRLKNGKWYERLVFEHIVKGEHCGHVVQWRDVTRRHNALVLVQTERDLLHSMMDSVPHQIYFKDTESRFTRVNRALAARYGLMNPHDAIGKSDADFYSEEHAAQTRLEEVEIMSSRTPQINKLHHEIWSDGSEAWNVSTKMPLIDTDGNVIGVYGIAHDITEQKRSEAIFWRQANFDSLTNLPNRRLMRDRWEQAAHLQERNGGFIALLLIDLDHFKEVNDTKGHDIGDELLAQAATRMSDCLRAVDTLARLGGDEFSVVLCDVTEQLLVEKVAQKILSCLALPFNLSSMSISISGSIGIGIFPKNGKELDEVLRCADKAMYQVKSKGGNNFAFFN